MGAISRPVSRQPGIYFHSASGVAASDLPRMDVAGFAGFASNGPLHTPVLVEDMTHYRDIFGDDIALAWDAQHKRMQYGLLGSTVDAFFRNGGQRCWIVRVAADSKNSAPENIVLENIILENIIPLAKFEIPGLYQADNLLPANINARSPGSWANSLRLSTRLNIQTLVVNYVTTPVSPQTAGVLNKVDNAWHIKVRSVPADLQAGDLLLLRCEGVRLYLFVQSQQADDTGMQLVASEVYWFEEPQPTSPPLSFSPDISSPQQSIDHLPIAVDEAHGLAIYEDYIASHSEQDVSVQWLRFDMLIWQGDALQSQVRGLTFHKDHGRFWGHLPDDQLLFSELINNASSNSQAASQADISTLLEDITYPRFALAGKSVDGNENFTDNLSGYYLPLDMGISSGSTQASAALNGASLAVENMARDGLAVFNAELFLDNELTGLSASNLINEANHQRFTVGRALRGIHSLLAIEEVSMIAVPDMLHRHWDRNSPDFKVTLQAPVLNKISAADEYGTRQLSWTASVGARRYIVQQSLSSDFENIEEHRIERPSPLTLDNDETWPQPPDTELKIAFEADCTRHYFFRVRAESGAQFTAWSNTQALRVPPAHFYNCEKPDPALLGLKLSASLPVIGEENAQKIISFIWEAEDSSSQVLNLADAFELQRATDLDFISAQTVYPLEGENASLLEAEIPLLSDALTWFRVRAISIVADESRVYGPWSNTVEIHPEKRRAQTLNSVETYTDHDLKIVQSELIRLCAARADTIAVLSLPSHYQHDQVSAAVDDLSNAHIAAPLELSYASLYFPWLRIVENDSPVAAMNQSNSLQLIPPVGAVCGKMSATANLRGAWIAAENAPLKNVSGLNQIFTDQQQLNLANKQVNVLAELPRGFVVLYANTLVRGVGRTNELKPLNVRRLLIMLRRLALREGAVYLFEPNSIDFRNRVQHYWDSRLNDLYRRGAFNGNSAEAAYRVVTDESVNDRRSLDPGRFIVELQVSPSRPLSFIHVRLVQNGSDQLQFQEL